MKIVLFWLKALFFLPGTFLHELSHFTVAKLLGAKITGFSLFPKMTRDPSSQRISYTYGSVHFVPKIRAFNFLIGLAPIMLWLLLYRIFDIMGIMDEVAQGNLMPSLSIKTFVIVYIFAVLLYSGRPSAVDIKMSIRGLFSFSGFILLLLVILALYYKTELAPYIDTATSLIETWRSMLNGHLGAIIQKLPVPA